jgi:GNAT superfamily N-acetyltransferase
VSYRVEPVVSSHSTEFDAAYGALAGEFASRGELERRDVIERWVDERPEPVDGLMRSYHLLLARTPEGALAGARDCHIVIDAQRGVAVLYLAHVLVLPAFRRTGLGALLRSGPIARVRRAVGTAKMAILVAAEMEPAQEDAASVVRLAAYGREGFSVIAPSAFPYCQPDFRVLASAADARPIPLLAVVRHLGHEGARTLPAALARAYLRHLYAVFATHVRLDHLELLARRSLAALAALATPDVPLLPLPRTIEDVATLAPLTRSTVMPFFPEELR